jgi:hypothetical protein
LSKFYVFTKIESEGAPILEAIRTERRVAEQDADIFKTVLRRAAAWVEEDQS